MCNDDKYNHMADDHSGAYYHDYEYSGDDRDPYEEYEDWYMETGYDPYHLFEEITDTPRVIKLLNRIRTTAGKIAVFFFVLLHLKPRIDNSEIPF